MEIKCEHCNKPMGEIRDASLRKGMVVYCHYCDKKIQSVMKLMAPKEVSHDIPDFLMGLFRK